MSRIDNRQNDEIRNFEFTYDFQTHPIASILVSFGGTRVLCSVSMEEKVPGWMKAQGVKGGWVTASYCMLPSATHTRFGREVKRGKESGRTMEIQRLIGRSLRAVVDLKKLDGLTLNVDCDVIDADGGTRCASITGASAALKLALSRIVERGLISENPFKEAVAAISIGIFDGEAKLDLCYEEDSCADVDMNIVMTESGKFIEIQGTAEERAFDFDQLTQMVNFAKKGISQIFKKLNN